MCLGTAHAVQTDLITPPVDRSTAGVTSASIADIVVPEQRATAFALSFACFSVGFCLASFVAPYCTRVRSSNVEIRHSVLDLVTHPPFRWLEQTASLQISATLFVTRVIWSVVVLPETLPPRTLNRRKSHWHIENPLRSMTILCRSRLFVSLTCLIALTSFVQMGLWQIRNFYLNVRCRCSPDDRGREPLLVLTVSCMCGCRAFWALTRRLWRT